MSQFRVNQFVKWQNRLYEPEHIGRIAVVVPPGVIPYQEWLEPRLDFEALHIHKFNLQPVKKGRDHESYIVVNRNSKTLKGKTRLLWPIVSLLQNCAPVPGLQLPLFEEPLNDAGNISWDSVMKNMEWVKSAKDIDRFEVGPNSVFITWIEEGDVKVIAHSAYEYPDVGDCPSWKQCFIAAIEDFCAITGFSPPCPIYPNA